MTAKLPPASARGATTISPPSSATLCTLASRSSTTQYTSHAEGRLAFVPRA